MLLIGADDEANARFGSDLAGVLGWPFDDALPLCGMTPFAEEVARDVVHSEQIRGSRVVAGWHLAAVVREVETRPQVAAARMTYARIAIDWSAVMVVVVGEGDTRAIALARAFGAYIGTTVAADRLFVAAPGLAFDVLLASERLGLDDTLLGVGTA